MNEHNGTHDAHVDLDAHDTGGLRADPTTLPLFAADTDPETSSRTSSRPGRVRSGFSMRPDRDQHGAPGARRVGGEPPAFDADTTGARPRRPVQGIDWAQVAAFRAQASDQLTAALEGDRGRLDDAAQQELGRAIIEELLASAAAEAVSAGREGWSLAEQDAMASAIFDALFGLGRLQPLVDDDRVENIIITGHQNVWLETVDGDLVPGPPVADSDEELVGDLVFLASRSQVNARAFSESSPRLHMRLDGGARLAASSWVTPRPSVVIRRHRLREATLEELVHDKQTLSPLAASFLRACVRARKSIVVSGPQGSGKTTTVRALCACLDPWEAIGTFETEYELHLHELPDTHMIVHAWEARPGSGEIGRDGRQAGEFTLDEALYDSFRFNLSRQIVGEVRGKEVWAMIKAMESGAGSISTTHARDAGSAMRKLVTCAMEAGPHVTRELAISKLAETVDIIVQLHLETAPNGDGTFRRRRWVSEIIAVDPGEEAKGYASTHVFKPAPGGGPAVADTVPDRLRDELTGHGFDAAGFQTEAQTYRATP